MSADREVPTRITQHKSNNNSPNSSGRLIIITTKNNGRRAMAEERKDQGGGQGETGGLRIKEMMEKIDLDEPADLDEEVLWKVRLLKYRLRETADDDGRVNIDAVINAYRDKKLKVDDNTTKIWYAGHLVMGPVTNDDPKLEELGLEIPRLEEQYGPGDLWSENYLSYVGPIGATSFKIVVDLPDDTGSRYIELFQQEIEDIGIPAHYSGRRQNVIRDTVTGQVVRRCLDVEIQLLVDGEAFGPVIRETVTVTPANQASGQRCSGMFLRKNFYTATCPSNGILYISDKKSGVVQQLPAN
ncbi:hypothetical protein AJ79_07768 [Helicocarpus griseus UAMH5409]|uniref:Uncharacterized protein n=1 Tax=Helicocarpus griseus UAMH5409 TaxID=1447875 RepID=A0A2B7WZE2_9EURO|nr:hypothetical protein AJ79_07768 [Helicocarpus griseus UAMH5409]